MNTDASKRTILPDNPPPPPPPPPAKHAPDQNESEAPTLPNPDTGKPTTPAPE